VISNVSSAPSIRLREDEDAPGCLPGFRPDLVREDRFFAGCFFHGASEEGGREEFDESADTRRCNSAISSACSAITRRRSTTSSRNPATCASSARNPATSARNAAFSATNRA